MITTQTVLAPPRRGHGGSGSRAGARRRKDPSRIWRIHVPLWLYLGFAAIPLYWMLLYAFRERGSGAFVPIPFTFDHLVAVWDALSFDTFLRNSVLISVATVILTNIIAIAGGYAIARFSFRGKGLTTIVLLCSQFIPGAMLLIPLFEIFRTFGLINSLTGLIIANTVFQLPLAVILMAGFIASVPLELEEAAQVDGCGRIRAFITVVAPLLRPGMVAVGAFAFIGAWNNFLFGLMFINKQELFPIPVGLSYLVGEFSADYNVLAAGGLVSILPVVLVFGFVQKYLIQGMTLGAVKG